VGHGISFSRRGFAPEFCKSHHMKREVGSEKKQGWRLPWFFTQARFASHCSRIALRFIRATKKEKERNSEAERRQTQ
jgi:hypothetical protein